MGGCWDKDFQTIISIFLSVLNRSIYDIPVWLEPIGSSMQSIELNASGVRLMLFRPEITEWNDRSFPLCPWTYLHRVHYLHYSAVDDEVNPRATKPLLLGLPLNCSYRNFDWAFCVYQPPRNTQSVVDEHYSKERQNEEENSDHNHKEQQHNMNMGEKRNAYR